MPAAVFYFILNPENINRGGRCKQSVTVNSAHHGNTINGDGQLNQPDTVNITVTGYILCPSRLTQLTVTGT